MAQTKLPTSQISDTYSASEQNTGKTWVDGRPVYRKTLRGQVSVVNGTANIAHGITGITTSFEVVSFQGFTKLGQGNGTSSASVQIYHRETAGNWCAWTEINATSIGLTASFAWGSTFYVATLEYVK